MERGNRNSFGYYFDVIWWFARSAEIGLLMHLVEEIGLFGGLIDTVLLVTQVWQVWFSHLLC